METNSAEQLNNMKGNWEYNQGLVVSSDGSSGGLALLWRPGTQVHVKKFSHWFIDAHIVYDITGIRWRLSWLTGFYGHPDTNKHEETWTLLESLGRLNTLPWLCLGDYNEILGQVEKAGGCHRLAKLMDHFCMAISHCGFLDLGYRGSPFTWSWNHPTKGRICIRLDRVLATAAWKSKFPRASVQHLSMSTLDHSMIAVHLPPFKTRLKWPRPPFCFEAMWLRDPRCVEIVDEAWMEGLYNPNGAQLATALKVVRLGYLYGTKLSLGTSKGRLQGWKRN